MTQKSTSIGHTTALTMGKAHTTYLSIKCPEMTNVKIFKERVWLGTDTVWVQFKLKLEKMAWSLAIHMNKLNIDYKWLCKTQTNSITDVLTTILVNNCSFLFTSISASIINKSIPWSHLCLSMGWQNYLHTRSIKGQIISLIYIIILAVYFYYCH